MNAQNRAPLEARFAPIFEASKGGDGCWKWAGTIGAYGYGILYHAGIQHKAHVLSLRFDGRPVPKGMLGCHHCDNPPCVRPDHLYVGTPADNAMDASSRDRLRFGEENFNAKLTESDVRAMRAMTGTYTEIARAFGVSRPTAKRAITGETWRRTA